jgi:hypothetical protein
LDRSARRPRSGQWQKSSLIRYGNVELGTLLSGTVTIDNIVYRKFTRSDSRGRLNVNRQNT